MQNLLQPEFMDAQENKILERGNSRSERMKTTIKEKKEKQRKDYRLMYVFPDEDADNESVKNDIKNILRMELQHQITMKN